MTARTAGWAVLAIALVSLLWNGVVLVLSRTTQDAIESFIGLLVSLAIALFVAHSLIEGDHQ